MDKESKGVEPRYSSDLARLSEFDMALVLFEDTLLVPNTSDYSMPDLAPYFSNQIPTHLSTSDALENFEIRLLKRESSWTDLSSVGKEDALIAASLQLNYYSWIGSAKTLTQRLSWPRDEFEYNDPAISANKTDKNGHPIKVKILEGLLPNRVRDAIELLTLYIINSELDAVSKFMPFSSTAGDFSIRIGDIVYTDRSSANILSFIETIIKPLEAGNISDSTNYIGV